jgi:hypothetical protein
MTFLAGVVAREIPLVAALRAVLIGGLRTVYPGV